MTMLSKASDVPNSSSSLSPPTAETITLSALKHVLKFYRPTLEAFYATKVKDSKKRVEALETDGWRYEELPGIVSKWKTSGDGDGDGDGGLNREELERLVTWKITHGTFRPFLLPQIRKNAAELISTVTSQACSQLKTQSDLDQKTIRSALDKVCTLTGVGPATGTLLLSVFNPISIPFFEDELFHWLNPEFAGKLKYSVKEYFEILEGVNSLRERLSGGNHSVTAWEVEKVAYVIGHWDMVAETEKAALADLMAETSTNSKDGGSGKTSKGDDVTSTTKRKTEVEDAKEGNAAKRAKKENRNIDEKEKKQSPQSKMTVSSVPTQRRSQRAKAK